MTRTYLKHTNKYIKKLKCPSSMNFTTIIIKQAPILILIFRPKDVAEVAINIAVNCRREIGAISGMDFIFDGKEKIGNNQNNKNIQ